MTIEEIPLPEMPDLPTLWAVHVQGPDDVIATIDRTEIAWWLAALIALVAVFGGWLIITNADGAWD